MWWAHFGAWKTVGAWEASVAGNALQDVQDRDLSSGGKKRKLRAFQVKVVLQLLRQVLEVPQTPRHHEVHASLHLQSDQEHPECRGLPGNNRPAANQTKLKLYCVTCSDVEFYFSYSFPFKSRFSLHSRHSGVTHLAFWSVQSCHSLGPWRTRGSQQP